MKRIPFYFVVLLLQFVPLHAKPYVIFQNVTNGLFAIFQMALSFCECYENDVIQGGHFDFKTFGLYYEASKGPNWWEYYFEPVRLGSQEGAEIITIGALNCYHIEFFNTRKHNHELIKKYIRFKPHITQRVNDFTEKNFKDRYVIGVHYRGTDKLGESTKVSYQGVRQAIQKVINSVQKQNWMIYVATDEEPFLKFLKSTFPNKVLYLPDAIRSVDGKATHVQSQRINGKTIFMACPNSYKNGEDAIVDSLLLSKTHYLLRTSSNLSLFSTFFNPDLPVLELNTRTQKGYLVTQEMLERCKNKKDPKLYFK